MRLTRNIEFKETTAGADTYRNALDAMYRMTAPPEENPALTGQLDLLESWLERVPVVRATGEP